MTDQEREDHALGRLLIMKLYELTEDQDLAAGISRMFRPQNYSDVSELVAAVRRVTMPLGAEARELVLQSAGERRIERSHGA